MEHACISVGNSSVGPAFGIPRHSRHFLGTEESFQENSPLRKCSAGAVRYFPFSAIFGRFRQRHHGRLFMCFIHQGLPTSGCRRAADRSGRTGRSTGVSRRTSPTAARTGPCPGSDALWGSQVHVKGGQGSHQWGFRCSLCGIQVPIVRGSGAYYMGIRCRS